MSEKTTQIVKVDPAEFGLDEVRADEIAAAFFPTVDKMKEFLPEFERLDAEEMTEEKCRDAKTLRLRYVKVRTGTGSIHKGEKAGYLAAGRYCDAWKNAQLEASNVYENQLKEWEDHYDNIEKARIDDLRIEREELLAETDLPHIELLGDLSEDAWNDLLAGAVAAKKSRLAEEAEAEEARKQAEQEAKEESDRVFKENERLKKEAAEAEVKRQAEVEKREAEEAKAESKRQAEEAARKAAQDKLDAERKAEEERKQKVVEEERAANEKKRAAERAEEEAKLKVEREAKEKAEAELLAKQEAEEEAKLKEEAAAQAELQMGDAQKMSGLVQELKAFKTKYSFESDEYQDAYRRAGAYLDALIDKLQQTIKVL